MKRTVEDRFGFIPKPISICCESFEISPVENYKKVLSAIEESTNKDKFIYPPIINRVEIDPERNTVYEIVPKTRRSAHLFRLPASHTIKIKNINSNLKELRSQDAGFLIHFLAYLLGYRVQYEDWWFDGRVQMDSQHNISISDEEIRAVLISSYEKWKSLTLLQQKRIINLLFMHTRNISYEWEWERFMMEYAVFDGCWRFYAEQNNLKDCAHGKRLKTILNKAEMMQDDKKVDKIIKLGSFSESVGEVTKK